MRQSRANCLDTTSFFKLLYEGVFAFARVFVTFLFYFEIMHLKLLVLTNSWQSASMASATKSRA